MNYTPDLSDGWGTGLVQGANRFAGQDQRTANLVADYLSSQSPGGKSDGADLIRMTLPGNLNKGLTDNLASLLGLGSAATDTLGATNVAGVLGAGGGLASLY